jgi:membrane fusion protein, copper/silver efflux system
LERRLFMNKTIFAIIILAVGLGTGFWFGQREQNGVGEVTELVQPSQEPLFYRSPMDPSITSPIPAKDSMGMDFEPVYAEIPEEKKPPEILFYRSPMDPSITSATPAKGQMGMDFEPVYAEEETSAEPIGTVTIDPVMVQNIGVRTVLAKQTSLSRIIHTVGRVDYNEEYMARLHPKTDGWIEELYINKTGERVEEDTILLNIYSPKLVSTQQEYLLALSNLKALKDSKIPDIRRGAENLVVSSLTRLQLLDVPAHQIRELEQSGKVKKALHIHSPVAGVVTRIGARKGQYVTPKTELYMIADLSNIWVYADVYEYELPWIKLGDEVEMSLTAVPGKTFTGHLSYIYPYAESRTRTIKVRLLFNNKELLLKPEMFADVKIYAGALTDVVVIPVEAIVRSGKINQVFVVSSPGKFEPRQVKLGLESDGKVVILSGIKAGDEVVTSAQFLIDSESKLREATSKMMKSLKQNTKTNTPLDSAAPEK